MRNEYVVDRLNHEIEFLKKELDIIKEERAKHDAQVIVAEIVLFIFGIFVGVLLMKQYGWRLL